MRTHENTAPRTVHSDNATACAFTIRKHHSKDRVTVHHDSSAVPIVLCGYHASEWRAEAIAYITRPSAR